MTRWPPIPAAVLLATLGVLLATHAAVGGVEVVQLYPVHDNTLYERSSGEDRSNGVGYYIFTGTTLTGDRRRAVLKFPVVDEIPSDAVVLDAKLTLYMSRTIVGSKPHTVHRLVADWGEAGSDAPGEEGYGGEPAPGDATWRHTFFDMDFWATEGGDFVAVPSAAQAVDQNGFYTWDDPGLADDLNYILIHPEEEFGWIVLGDEDSVPSAKRFNSRENPDQDTWPVLEVTYDAGPPVAVENSTWGQIKKIYAD